MATLEERIYEGNRAKECLENEAFIWAFEGIEQELEGREKIYLSLQLLTKLKATITHSMETGKLADLELQHRKTLADRAKEILRF
jgi:hypothetical protein